MYHFAALSKILPLSEILLGVRNEDSLKNKNILDIGCGRGGGLAFLAKHYNI